MLSDPRRQKSVRYIASEMMACLIVAFLANCSSTYQAVAWCKRHVHYLQSLGLKLINGVASYDTHQRMLRNMDTESFAQDFILWMNELLCCCNLHLAIDGKGLRGGTEKIIGQKTPYMLNVVNTQTGFVIASIPICEKGSELKSIPEALALIAVAGNTFTIDAIGTYLEIMSHIIDEDGNFILLVKRNNPDAYANLVSFFETQRSTMERAKNNQQKPEQDYHYDSTGWKYESNRERYEYRHCEAIHYSEELKNAELGENVFGLDSMLGRKRYLFNTVGMITSVRIKKIRDELGNDITPDLNSFMKSGSPICPHPSIGDSEKDDIQRYGIISNLELTAEELLGFKRMHWKCETAHYVLDVTFREDFSSAKEAKYNASLFRKIAYNICKLARWHKLIPDHSSTPIESREIAETPELMAKLLHDHLPMIIFD